MTPIPDDAMCFFRDGNKWACVYGNFVDLQESPAGFGDDFDAALADLQQGEEKQGRRAAPLAKERPISEASTKSRGGDECLYAVLRSEWERRPSGGTPFEDSGRAT